MNIFLFKSWQYTYCVFLCLYIGINKLTLIQLVADDDEKSDAAAEHVENDANRVYGLPPPATHAVDNVLIIGRFAIVSARCQNNQSTYNNHH